MLASLRISHLAIVEDLSLELRPGFTVLTGETGAGNSLLVEALALLIGARGDSDTVRAGCDRATVEAVVEGHAGAWGEFLAGRGLPEEAPVVLRREVAATGRSRAWINGAPCSMQDLREASRIWIRLASQHDHQALLSEERHLALLDEVLGIQADLGSLVEAIRAAEGALRARRHSEEEREQRLRQLGEQIEDLGRLGPLPGEWAQLREEREPLRHAAKLAEHFGHAAESLAEALPLAERAARSAAAAAELLAGRRGESDRLRSLALELEDLKGLAEEQALRWSGKGAEALEALEGRLAQYERLARRHHCEPGELPDFLQTLRTEAEALRAGEAGLAALEKHLEAACLAYLAQAEALHARRDGALKELERQVMTRLRHLGMEGARLQARLSEAEDPKGPVVRQGLGLRATPKGFSTLSFWLESNPGEGFRPLARIASGGELSRVMLALLGAGVHLGESHGEGRTLILDEVDAGLGGQAALAVGEAIRELAGRHQILTVTHLPQVAARADHHGCLAKAAAGGRTRSEFRWVEGEDRTRELARLLSGQPSGPEALEHARALLR
ncbi:MAG: hypothetical protein HY823_10245 [Acidobacteria bacterium]|nr:hypothetical protein [Acidobacteriota bacterium]